MNTLRTLTGSIIEDARINTIKRVKETGFDYSKYKKHLIDKCDLCNGSDFRLYCHMDRYGLPVRSMQCRDCSLIFISPRINSQDYSTFYKLWYRKLIAAIDGFEMKEKHFEASREKQADEVLKFLGKFLPDTFEIHNVLDVGGSIGSFCKKVCDISGAKGYVVDPNVAELEVAKKKGLVTSSIPFEDWNSKVRFDLIAMLKTVEHLQSISAAFTKIKTLADREGVLLIDIVNHDWLIRMMKDATLTTKLDHIYQLTNKTIEAYFDKFKFKIIGHSDKDKRFVYYLVKV